jgi:hypothetical protein
MASGGPNGGLDIAYLCKTFRLDGNHSASICQLRIRNPQFPNGMKRSAYEAAEA